MVLGLPPMAFVGALFLFIPHNYFKSLRWSSLLKQMGVNRRVGTLFNLNIASFAPSVLSPGRIAEFVKTLPLVNTDCTLSVAIGSAVVDRLFDLGFVICFGMGGVFLFFGTQSVLKLSLIIALSIAGIYIGSRVLLSKILNSTWSGHFQNLGEAFDKLGKGTVTFWTKTLTSTFMLWLSYYLSIRILAGALGIPLSLGVIFLVFSAIAVLNLVPVSIAGVGTRDALLVLFFARQGWQAEQAMALAGAVLALLFTEALISLIYLTALSWLSPDKYGNMTGKIRRI